MVVEQTMLLSFLVQKCMDHQCWIVTKQQTSYNNNCKPSVYHHPNRGHPPVCFLKVALVPIGSRHTSRVWVYVTWNVSKFTQVGITLRYWWWCTNWFTIHSSISVMTTIHPIRTISFYVSPTFPFIVWINKSLAWLCVSSSQNKSWNKRNDMNETHVRKHNYQ